MKKKKKKNLSFRYWLMNFFFLQPFNSRMVSLGCVEEKDAHYEKSIGSVKSGETKGHRILCLQGNTIHRWVPGGWVTRYELSLGPRCSSRRVDEIHPGCCILGWKKNIYTYIFLYVQNACIRCCWIATYTSTCAPSFDLLQIYPPICLYPLSPLNQGPGLFVRA